MRPLRRRRGFTLIEMLVALSLGSIVISAAMKFTINSLRGIQAQDAREDVSRTARFLGLGFDRDVRAAGVGFASTRTFGSLSTLADTVVILSVPFTPAEAPPHQIATPLAAVPPGVGTCGPTCIDVLTTATGMDLAPGDIACLQVASERRLILVTAVAPRGDTTSITFAGAPRLLLHAAGLSNSLQVDLAATFIQKLTAVEYYMSGDSLMRVVRIKTSGLPDPDLAAEGMSRFTLALRFEDGHEANFANATDADATNDFDQIVGLHISGLLTADRIVVGVNGSRPVNRKVDWRFAPRNLLYEHNR